MYENKIPDVTKLRNQGATWTYIGSILGLDRRTVKRLYNKGETNKQYDAPKLVSPITVERFKPLHVTGNAVLSCDWHTPLHSPRMVNILLEKAYKYDIKTLVIAGDFLNLDSFSHFLPHQPEARFELEKEESTRLLDACLDVFDEVVISWGNHEHRISKFLNHQLSFEFCMRWILEGLGEDKLGRVKFTELDYLIYHLEDKEIRVCHPNNFSKIPLTTSRELAKKYHTSIFTAHSHHFAQGVGYDGKTLLFEGGGLFSPERTEYVQRSTTHHVWVQGFYIAKDGVMLPFSPIYNNI